MVMGCVLQQSCHDIGTRTLLGGHHGKELGDEIGADADLHVAPIGVAWREVKQIKNPARFTPDGAHSKEN